MKRSKSDIIFVSNHRLEEGTSINNFGLWRWIKKHFPSLITFFTFSTFAYLQFSVDLSGRELKYLRCSRWSDMRCGMNLWRGQTYEEENEKYEVSVVMSYCDEDLSKNMNYINDRIENITVRSIAAISRCALLQSNTDLPRNITRLHSNAAFPEINFIQYLESNVKKYIADPSMAIPEENHMILFLKAEALQKGRLRKLDDVVQSAKEHGFGCVNQAELMMSYYHDTKVLRTFTITKALETYDYSNFGEWLDHINASSIIDQEFVPVCYGSSFAIHEKDLVSNLDHWYPLIKAIGEDFVQHKIVDRIILAQYIERVLAAIFSHNLSEERLDSMKSTNPSVIEIFPYTGALTPNERSIAFFTGGILDNKLGIDLSKLRFSLVISHCNEDMAWMQAHLEGLEMTNVTIYSKCNSTINGYVPPGSEIITLPNHGRCDHSYAYHMMNMKEEDNTDNHYVIFYKASRRIHQPGMSIRSLHDMIKIATQHGFGCEMKHALDRQSYYHNTDQLKTYALAKYKGQWIKSGYAMYGDWLQNLDVDLPTPYTPVCYGGVFAVKASQIYLKQKEFKKIAASLTRGDSIEEGHFVERVWAGLLSYPLDANETSLLYSIPSVINPINWGYVGSLLLD